jgi:coenzyme F420-reducing hydrogenase alpha subunit
LGFEGRLDIELACRAAAVRRVDVRSSRPLRASRVLEGGSPDEALERLPLVFSICATAQAEAALSACEQALSLSPSMAHKRAREMLVWMETAREHLLRILLDWPAFADEPLAREGLPRVVQLLPELSRALYGNAAPFHLGRGLTIDFPALAQVIAELRSVIAGLLGGGEALPLHSLAAFEHWLERGDAMPARLLRRLRERGWDRLGRSASVFLPPLQAAALHPLFTAEDGESFLTEPSWQGAPCETTPLQRQRHHPLLQELLQSGGNGLLTRLVARLVELEGIPERLQQGMVELESAPLALAAEPGPASASGIGLAQVEAARGLLIHRLEIDDGVVRRFQILAPTEWNFHPQGVAAQGLYTLDGGDEEQLRQQAALWINAIDPCVGFNLRVSGDA